MTLPFWPPSARGLAARCRPAILMYHRIASPRHDPWSLAVSAAHFADQLVWLARHRAVLDMAEFVSRLRAGSLPHDAVAITFDDGYYDNFSNAQPLLEQSAVPATVFAVRDAVVGAHSFWWDDLVAMTLANPQAASGALTIAGERIAFAWARSDDPGPRRGWRAFKYTLHGRARAHNALWRALLPLSDQDRDAALAELAKQTGRRGVADGHAMSPPELTGLLARRRFTLGGHSLTHAALRTLDDDALSRDLAGSLAFVRQFSGTGEIPGFAYPYGDVDQRVRNAVASAGFAWACTTRSAVVDARDDPFMLPRLAVEDWPATVLAQHLAEASAAA